MGSVSIQIAIRKLQIANGHDLQPHYTFLGKLVRVAEEIEEDLAHFSEVCAHAADILRADDFKPVTTLGHEWLNRDDDVVDHLPDLEVFEVQGHLARLDLREIEDAVDRDRGGGWRSRGCG